MRIHQAVERYIPSTISGAVTLVARRGRIAHVEAHGVIDLESKQPMRRDSLFRLASMSKPITAVAVMLLVEEGKVRLTDPVSRFIPEFKGSRVAVPKPGAQPAPFALGGPNGQGGRAPEVDTVSASRDITIQDLLTHTSGLMSGGLGTSQAGALAVRGPSDTLATYIPKLGAVPLDFQPGTSWRYSALAGFDVLSRIVEIASGQTYDQFLKQRLFDPLGMKDTVFALTPALAPRAVTLYFPRPNGLERLPDQNGFSSATYLTGAAGLISTVDDCAQFAQMLANGGELNGKRYLSPRTVALMASNHTGDMVSGQMGLPVKGMGFGLGVSVVEDPVAAGLRQSKGTWGWFGAFGTDMKIDPKENMVSIIMMQTLTPALHRDFENAVMQAIVD
jgi:CubicO group peptidase (beta-lactamase class C family)